MGCLVAVEADVTETGLGRLGVIPDVESPDPAAVGRYESGVVFVGGEGGKIVRSYTTLTFSFGV